jgi:hypothetical protein
VKIWMQRCPPRLFASSLRGIRTLARLCIKTSPTLRGSRLFRMTSTTAASESKDTKQAGEGAGKAAKRGAFIVFEGLDRCGEPEFVPAHPSLRVLNPCAGKTTQSKRLVDYLNSSGHPTLHLRFPGPQKSALRISHAVCLQTAPPRSAR